MPGSRWLEIEVIPAQKFGTSFYFISFTSYFAAGSAVFSIHIKTSLHSKVRRVEIPLKTRRMEKLHEVKHHTAVNVGEDYVCKRDSPRKENRNAEKRFKERKNGGM